MTNLRIVDVLEKPLVEVNPLVRVTCWREGEEQVAEEEKEEEKEEQRGETEREDRDSSGGNFIII